MIRAIIVDDEPKARDGLGLLLGQQKEIEVILIIKYPTKHWEKQGFKLLTAVYFLLY